MNNYVYLTGIEIYLMMKKLLSEGVEFSKDIRSRYFTIMVKSKILAIKVSRTWYVNMDNWGVEDPKVLEKIDPKSITPGSYSIKLLKEHLRDNYMNFNRLWPALRNDVNKVIKSGYNSGLLYARPGFYNQKVYHYDINSAYGEAFQKVDIPIGAPEKIDGYVKPDGKHLHIYLAELNVEFNSQTIFPYLVNSSDIHKLPSQVVENTGYSSLYKVITETELKDLRKDYIVYDEILYTLRFKKQTGFLSDFVEELYNKRYVTKGQEQVIWKTVLASLAGKFSQEIKQTQTPIGIDDFGNIQYHTENKDLEDVSYISPQVSLFIVDYVRKKLRDSIKKVGYKNVLLADTDGFISTVPVDLPLNNKIGGWKVATYDNIIVNGTRSYFYTQNNEFHSSISGLGDIYNDGLNEYTYKSIESISKLKPFIPVSKQVVVNGEYKYTRMNINIGGRK